MAIGDIGEFTSLSLGTKEVEGDPSNRAKLFYKTQNWLQTDGSLTIDQNDTNNGTLSPNPGMGQSPGLIFGSSGSEGIASKRTATGNQNGLDFYTSSTVRLSITSTGNISIGSSGTPGNLTVNGALTVGSLVEPTSLTVNGTATTTGALSVGTAAAANLTVSGNVGIGTATPQARLQVASGAIMPSAGHAETAGIMFPKDPSGGSGDAAWLRYYPRTGEACTLELGISNDADDHIALMSSGNVGIGTPDPVKKLFVKGEMGTSRMGISFESSQDIEVNSATLQQMNAVSAQANQAVQSAQTAAETALIQTTEAETSTAAALPPTFILIGTIQGRIPLRPWAIALLQLAGILQALVTQSIALTDVAQAAAQTAVNLKVPPDSLQAIGKAIQALQAAQTAITQAVQQATQLTQQAQSQLPEVVGVAQQTNQAIQAAQTQINEAVSAATQAQTAAQTAQTALNNPLLEIYAYGIGARQQNSLVYDSYAFHRWHVRGMEKLRLESDGNFYIGNTASESNAKLTVDDPTVDNAWNTAAFRKPAIGPNWSHIHHGPQGDWYIRSAANNGKVVIQDNSGLVQIGGSGTVQIGGNRSGAFVRFNDDLWFSDPQNGTIEIKNGPNNDWGTMVGKFNPPSSATYKQNISPLQTSDLEGLLEDTLNLNLVQFRYHGQDQNHRLSLGIIAEECPTYIVGDDGKSLSTTEYIAMLHGAIKVLATKLAVVEQQYSCGSQFD